MTVNTSHVTLVFYNKGTKVKHFYFTTVTAKLTLIYIRFCRPTNVIFTLYIFTLFIFFIKIYVIHIYDI